MEPIYHKYPRTWHLPWSPGVSADDKVLRSCATFEGQRVIITLKMDGENTTAHSDGHIHARSIDSRGGEDRAWVKKFLTENVCFNLPQGWRVCGENLWAEHSISYTCLPSYFLGFSIWNEHNECLSWDQTMEWFQLLGIVPVEVLYDGQWDEKLVREMARTFNTTSNEGFVVRLADSFKYEQFQTCVAKWVRANHVQTDKHWRAGVLKPNGVAYE